MQQPKPIVTHISVAQTVLSAKQAFIRDGKIVVIETVAHPAPMFSVTIGKLKD